MNEQGHVGTFDALQSVCLCAFVCHFYEPVALLSHSDSHVFPQIWKPVLDHYLG